MLNLNFWNENPNKAALSCEKLFMQSKEISMQIAEDALKQSFTFKDHWEMEKTNIPVKFENKINWEHVENGDIEWMFAFNRHTFLVHLAKAYLYTKNKKYIDAAAKLWEDWIDNAPFAEESKTTTWRSIETGLRCENWLRALALIGKENFSQSLLAKIEESLHQHAIWLIDAHKAFQKISNWGVLQDHGLFLLGIAFNKQQWVKQASQRLAEQLKWQVTPDGVHWEQSPMYHCEVLHCCLNTVLVARSANVALPQAFCKATHRMAKALPQMVRTDGIMLAKSDSDEIDVRDLVCTASMLFVDANLKNWLNAEIFAENIWDFTSAQQAEYAAIGVGENIIGSTAHCFAGDYYLRSGQNHNATMLHLHCGALGGGHGHADQLHIDLSIGNEMILTDTGRYTYVENDLRKKLKSATGHNTIIIDEKEFSTYIDSWAFDDLAAPIKGEHCFTPTVDFAEAMHLGYFEQGVLPRRRVLRLGEYLWVIWDTIYAAGKHNMQTTWHFGADGIVEEKEDSIIYKGKNASASLYAVGQNLQKQLTKAPLSREYNRIEYGCLLTLSQPTDGNGFMGMVVAGSASEIIPKTKVELVPAYAAKVDKLLPQNEIQALKITQDGQEWLLVFAQKEVFGTVDMFCVEGKYGHGRVVVYGPGCEEGKCLIW